MIWQKAEFQEVLSRLRTDNTHAVDRRVCESRKYLKRNPDVMKERKKSGWQVSSTHCTYNTVHARESQLVQIVTKVRRWIDCVTVCNDPFVHLSLGWKYQLWTVGRLWDSCARQWMMFIFCTASTSTLKSSLFRNLTVIPSAVTCSSGGSQG